VGPVRSSAAYALRSRILLGESVDAAPYLDAMEKGIRIAGNSPSNTRVLVQAFLAAGALDRAESIARLGQERAGGRLRLALCESALGDVMLAHGPARFDEAATWYGRALDRARALGSRSAVGWALLGLGELSLRRGGKRQAMDALDEALAIFEAIGLRGDADHARHLLSEIGAPDS
jgi:tetratricopeptide (TPR) repeat protein